MAWEKPDTVHIDSPLLREQSEAKKGGKQQPERLDQESLFLMGQKSICESW